MTVDFKEKERREGKKRKKGPKFKAAPVPMIPKVKRRQAELEAQAAVPRHAKKSQRKKGKKEEGKNFARREEEKPARRPALESLTKGQSATKGGRKKTPSKRPRSSSSTHRPHKIPLSFPARRKKEKKEEKFCFQAGDLNAAVATTAPAQPWTHCFDGRRGKGKGNLRGRETALEIMTPITLTFVRAPPST